jgi:hypothetical protein
MQEITHRDLRRPNSARNNTRFNQGPWSGAHHGYEEVLATRRSSALPRDGARQSQGDNPQYKRDEGAFSFGDKAGQGEIEF